MKTIAIRAAIFAVAVASLGALGGCGRSFSAATPPGFVDLGTHYGADEYRAATADGVVIGVRAFDNDPKGESAFWQRAIENRMRDIGGYALLDKREVKNRAGQAGTALKFGHDEGNQPSLHVIALFVTDKKIFLLEAGGPKGEVERVMPQIDWSIRNLYPH